MPIATDPPAPTYDRTTVTRGIAHVGVGGFHRAHQAVYVDRLLRSGVALDWGIVGIGLLPGDAAMRDALATQDCLYTVVAKHDDGTLEPRTVGSIIDYVFAPDDPESALVVLTDPAIRIVSLTITEGGYHLDDTTGDLVLDAALRADLVPGAVPSTAFGYLVEALDRRRAAGHAPFTVLSCDNIETNGDVARRAVTAFAALRDAELASWIRDHVSFPSSMVDRITPATTDEDRADLARLGITDRWPVVCEPFTQWVLEDDFCAGRPPLEQAGVQLVADVRPYEQMKLRLLNASHQALGHLGRLAGHHFVHEAAQDPRLATFVRDYMTHEATPSLASVPGVDLARYRTTLMARFANPHVCDTLDRICADAANRLAKFVVPVVRDRVTRGGELDHCTLILAAWAHGPDEAADPPRALELLGDLRHSPALRAAYLAALRSLRDHGVEETLDRWNAQQSKEQ